MASPFAVAFPNGNRALAVRVGRQEEIGEALDALGLETQRPVLVLIGSSTALRRFGPPASTRSRS